MGLKNVVAKRWLGSVRVTFWFMFFVLFMVVVVAFILLFLRFVILIDFVVYN